MAQRGAKVKDYRVEVKTASQWLKEWKKAEENKCLLVVEVYSSYFGKTEVPMKILQVF